MRGEPEDMFGFVTGHAINSPKTKGDQNSETVFLKIERKEGLKKNESRLSILRIRFSEPNDRSWKAVYHSSNRPDPNRGNRGQGTAVRPPCSLSFRLARLPRERPIRVKLRRTQCRQMSPGFPLPAQPVDATQALNLSAGVSNCKVSRGRSFS